VLLGQIQALYFKIPRVGDSLSFGQGLGVSEDTEGSRRWPWLCSQHACRALGRLSLQPLALTWEVLN